MIFWRLAATFVSFAVCLAAVPARADVNEFQIDWMLSQKDLSVAASKQPGRSARYDFRLLPSKLFVSDDEIVAVDGTKLLPAGSQLYAMTGPAFAVCSQRAAKAPFAAAKKRICFRDDDGDGSLDSFWMRTPIQQALGKGEWLIMNSEVPAKRGRVSQPKLRSISPDLAEVTGELSLSFALNDNGTIAGGIWVRNGGIFSGSCVPMQRSAANASEQFCLVRDLVVRGVNFASPNQGERRLDVVFPQRDVKVRFAIKKGLLSITVNGIYLQ